VERTEMDEKDLDWRGTTLEDIKMFPNEVKKDVGFELHKNSKWA
jgi:hypothetical protein